MLWKFLLVSLFAMFFLVKCIPTKDPNENTYSESVMNKNEIVGSIPGHYEFIDSVYVPIYSDIYSHTKETHFLLTATLSVRNTSYYDTLLISTIDYFDTKGDLVRQYLDQAIYLKPMASIDYVIEEDDKSGGTGANFVVVYHTTSDRIKPVIQAVMISTNGQQGVSFTTDGVSISQ